MRRRYNTGQYLAAVERLRSGFPGCALTTDILTGFPGETEEEFSQTEEFIKLVGYSRIHVFPYSPRPGTRAAALAGQLDKHTKQEHAFAVRELTEAKRRVFLRQLSSMRVMHVAFDGGGSAHGVNEWYADCRMEGGAVPAGHGLVPCEPVRAEDACLAVRQANTE